MEEVAVFGQGNVALDVARILLKPIDELKVSHIFKLKLILDKKKS